jgi:hypothetical protein
MRHRPEGTLPGRGRLLVCWAAMALAVWGGEAWAQERSLSDLAFMSGCWRGKLAEGDGTIEERYNSPAAGLMLGTSHVIAGGKTSFYELIIIEQSSEGIAMTPSPRGNRSVPFKLVRFEPKRAVFENLEHDFPKRILYELREDGSLVARVEGDRPEKTQEFVMDAISCEPGTSPRREP